MNFATIRVRLTLALLAIGGLTAAMGGYSSLTQSRIAATIQGFATDVLPSLTAAQAMLVSGTRLVTTSQGFATVDQVEDKDRITGQMRALLQNVRNQLAQVPEREAVAGELDRLASALSVLDAAVTRRLAAETKVDALRADLLATQTRVSTTAEVVAKVQRIVLNSRLSAIAGLGSTEQVRDAIDTLGWNEAHWSDAASDAQANLNGFFAAADAILTATDNGQIAPAQERARLMLLRLAAVRQLPSSPQADALKAAVNGLGSYLDPDHGVVATRAAYLDAALQVSRSLAEAASVSEALSGRIQERANAIRAATDQELARTLARAQSSRRMIAGLSLFCLLFALAVLALYVSPAILRRIARLNAGMLAIAGGDLGVEVGVSGADELGDMARALEVFRANAADMTRLRAEQDAAKQQAEADRRRGLAEMGRMLEASMGASLGAMSEAARALRETAQSLAVTADEGQSRSTEVAAAASNVSDNIATVATATEELVASIGEIARQAGDAVRITADASAEATSTGRLVDDLKDASDRIGHAVELISDIAGKTNLLALNATIEAARAGDAGKGFAVVASEVKALANQTKHATDEIAGQVRAIQNASQASSNAIGHISAVIGRTEELARAIAEAIRQQNTATAEITRNVNNSAQNFEHVDGAMTLLSEGSRRTNDASGKVLHLADDLSSRSGSLQEELRRFLAKALAA
jgi:methyl-accepting chemotaxis protein